MTTANLADYLDALERAAVAANVEEENYRKAAMDNHGPCGSEQRAIAMLLGVPVKQTSRIVDGTPVCEYLIELNGADTPGTE